MKTRKYMLHFLVVKCIHSLDKVLSSVNVKQLIYTFACSYTVRARQACKQKCKLPRTTFLLRTQSLFIHIQNKSSVYVPSNSLGRSCPLPPASVSPLPFPCSLVCQGTSLILSPEHDDWCCRSSCGWFKLVPSSSLPQLLPMCDSWC